MGNILGFGKKVITLTEREQYIFNIVDGILKFESSMILINPENMDYYINSKEHHLDIIIGGSYIAITNSDTYVKEDFRGDFIDHCKNNAKIRATKDREKLKSSIMERERSMLERITNLLTKSKNNAEVTAA